MSHSAELESNRAQGAAVAKELLLAMRPKDWIKNVFVFAAIAFSSGRLWMNPIAVAIVVAAFLLFCMVAGSIYLINDLVDIEKDRAHPKKRNRPLASGRLSPTVAKVAAAVFLCVAIPSAFALDAIWVSWEGNAQPWWHQIDFGVVLLSYMVIQGILYSYYLKNVVLLDVFTIAAGFVLRAVAGAMVLDIQITEWLLVCMGLLSLFLAFAKRRAELVLLEGGAGEHRKILQEYSLPMLDQMMSIVTAAIIVAYTFFTTSSPTLPKTHGGFSVMLFTVPLVVYAIFRYLYLIYKKGGGGNPADIVIGDRPFTISLVLWGVLSMLLLVLAPLFSR